MSSDGSAGDAAGEARLISGQMPLIDLSPAEVARRLRALDWAFSDARPGEHTHALHPYPAKFVPDLPRRVIELLSRRGDLVLDPFSGGGTAGVEALVAGRRFHGIDANRVGNTIARAKTNAADRSDLRMLRELEAAMLALSDIDLTTGVPAWLPSIPNVDKWYDPTVFHALGLVRHLVMSVSGSTARDLALVAFVQAAARLSFQESETRYASKPRPIRAIEVPRAVVSELRRVRLVSERLRYAPSQEMCFVDGDARDARTYPAAGSVGLVVTSPPYPNTYDYHLYHRFRLFWLGEDPGSLRRVEIGSHLKNQALEDPIAAYVADMRAALRNCHSAVSPGRYVVLVVGDGLFHGTTFATAHALAEVATDLGFDHVATLTRLLPVHRRSVTKPGRRLLAEQILVLRRPAGERDAVAAAPGYSLFGYERDLQLRELAALGASPRTEGDKVAIVPVRAVDRAAFTHAVRHPRVVDGSTLQRRLEDALPPTSRRKNSTYFAHGIHRYKGKFYPQLAKSLLNLSGVTPGESLVLDPFGGSGTVALEAMLNGLDVVSVDCNPVAIAIARAKVLLVSQPTGRSRAGVARVEEALRRAPPAGSPELTEFPEPLRDELRRWFPEPVLAKLGWLLQLVRSDVGGAMTGVFEVLVSDLVREVSQQEPRDLRIRRRATPVGDAPVYELFARRLSGLDAGLTVFARVAAGHRPPSGHGSVIYGDSSEAAVFAGLRGRSVDAVVSSPPYAAALPYIDTDRLSLAAVFGYAASDRRPLEAAMIGSREITERARAAYEAQLLSADETLPDSTLAFLRAYQEAVRADAKAGFRRRQAPAVLLRYFRGMRDVLTNVAAHATHGASCWFVLGNSRSTIGGREWVIPTVDEVASIGEHLGFTLVDRIPITVTRENGVHARNAITRNEILQLRA